MSAGPPGFWSTVRLLLGAARRRAAGRRRRQRELLGRRTGRQGTGWGGLGALVPVVVAVALNVAAAVVVERAVAGGERVEAERQGWVVVGDWFAGQARSEQDRVGRFGLNRFEPDRELQPYYLAEARQITGDSGGDEQAVVARLRDTVRAGRADLFLGRDVAAPGLAGLGWRGLPAMLGSVALLWWSAMLVLQGEGVDLDVQRRRHPMWEWLAGHPVRPGAVFLAEMLAPVAANPAYGGAMLVPGVLYGMLYGGGAGLLAAVLVGVPVAVSAACLGKGLEIGVMLRFAPRSRGALVGIMGWLGYTAMMLLVVGVVEAGRIATVLAHVLGPLAALPWPWLGWFLGEQADGSFSFAAGVLACWCGAGAVTATSVGFAAWGARRGLGGAPGGAVPARGGGRFGRAPLVRKELLWFTRDWSALVQVILVPATMGGFQMFNMRGLVSDVSGQWYTLCGAAVVFGTYFLAVLGPKSLASEGAALWLALTWPHGLEALLRAKARLWTWVSSAIVGVLLCGVGAAFPGNAAGVALVGAGWVLFAHSMADKAVTLATVTQPSGEQEKVPSGRAWATQLGTLTFAIGVLTAQWTLAATGIVYSTLTAAAMWQNFRARLPFLHDPWSEPLPEAPTLMHAMVAISGLVEAAALLTGGLLAFVARDTVAVGQALVYGACAAGVSVAAARFLRRRGVTLRDVWVWEPAGGARVGAGSGRRPDWAGVWRLAGLVAAGAGAGVGLGGLGRLYVAALHRVPWAAALLDAAQGGGSAIPHLRESVFAMAVLIAPFAEEYLFRGLLYRALDREWGGWRAVLGSAAFFAIYHPPLSWLPVGVLGVANALLFRRTGRLLPAVALHMAYNAVVLG
ncbi:MAG: CPBP family intramembrane glutamic endopeptidase [Janthinobacterium lividum]